MANNNHLRYCTGFRLNSSLLTFKTRCHLFLIEARSQNMTRFSLKRLFVFSLFLIALFAAIMLFQIVFFYVKAEYFNRQIEAANYCSRSPDCELIRPDISGSCSKFANRLEMDKLISLHEKLQLMPSFIDCFLFNDPPSPTCTQNKCF